MQYDGQDSWAVQFDQEGILVSASLIQGVPSVRYRELADKKGCVIYVAAKHLFDAVIEASQIKERI